MCDSLLCIFQKDEDEVLAAKMEWWEDETKILTLLHSSAKEAMDSGRLDQEEASKFFCSGKLCWRGIMSCSDGKTQVRG